MTERICSIDTCPKPLHKKGWCTTHYSRWYETGDPETPLTRIPKDAICIIEGCDGPRKSNKGWCRKHYTKAQRNGGDPLGGRVLNGEHQRYFFANLMIATTECKIWPYNLDPDGYPTMKLDGRRVRPHRLACAAWNGEPITPRMEAAHGPCHTRACWNGAHLSWKTRSDNAADMSRDGTLQQGMLNPNVIFTDDQVREIRAEHAAGISRRVLASRFSVHRNTIDVIVRRVAWKHVD
jgi:hypothetical protein